MTAKEILQWRKDAIADGWTQEPIYKTEPVEDSAALKKDGYICQIYLRPSAENPSDKASHIVAWGPDGLIVEVSDTYDMAQLQKNLSKCSECGAEGVKTERVSFAGRCCEKCLPAARKKYEYPGWAD